MSEITITFGWPVRVACVERMGPREEIGKTLEELSRSLKEMNVRIVGPAMALFYGNPKSFDPQKAHYEVCFPISGKIKGEGEIKAKELGKGSFASITHSGPPGKLPETYGEILKWIEENGYQISGPAREIYPKGIEIMEGSQQDCLIEIQIPVSR
jgi:effector-binding domain-containing protein